MFSEEVGGGKQEDITADTKRQEAQGGLLGFKRLCSKKKGI